MPVKSLHGDVTTFFAPDDDCAAVLCDLVTNAKKSVYILDYGYTLATLTDALVEALARGVHVYCIFDHTQAGGHAEAAQLERLTQADVPWIEGTSPEHHQILHSKFTVVDGVTVLYGSYNFTESAGFQSNTCSVSSGRIYAAGFLAHWYRIFAFVASHEADLQPDKTTAIRQPLPEAQIEQEAA